MSKGRSVEGRSYHPKMEFSVPETAPLTFPYQYWYLAQHGTCGSQYEPLKTHGGASTMGSKAARAIRCSVRVLLPLVPVSRLGPLPAGMVAETARARARGKESTAQKRIFVGQAECGIVLVTSPNHLTTYAFFLRLTIAVP